MISSPWIYRHHVRDSVPVAAPLTASSKMALLNFPIFLSDPIRSSSEPIGLSENFPGSLCVVRCFHGRFALTVVWLSCKNLNHLLVWGAKRPWKHRTISQRFLSESIDREYSNLPGLWSHYHSPFWKMPGLERKSVCNAVHYNFFRKKMIHNKN